MSASDQLRGATVNAPAERKPNTFSGMLEEMKPQLAAALPKHLSVERMMRVALTCFRNTPDLARCDPKSVMAAVVQASQLGLEPGLLGQAYLIPFKRNWKDANDQWQSRLECQFIPGYKGLISLARRSGDVTSINATCVYEKDTFKLTLGINPSIEHEPTLEGERGAVKLVYAVAKFKDGGYHLEWMTVAEIEAVRQRSKASKSGPWVTDWEQMAKKTVIRRMSNYLPMSVEFMNAVVASDAVDQGRSITIDGDYVAVDEDDRGALGDESGQPPADQHQGQQSEQGKSSEPTLPAYAELRGRIEKEGATPDEKMSALSDSTHLPKNLQDELQALAFPKQEATRKPRDSASMA